MACVLSLANRSRISLSPPLHAAADRCNILVVVQLDLDAIRSRIKRVFEGKAARVINEWPTEPAPHPSTLSRWLNGKTLPRTRDDLLSLAGALDLDPLAMWTTTKEQFPSDCAKVVRSFHDGKWTRLDITLSYLREFVGPLIEWPPNEIASHYFHRDWC